MPFKPLQAQSVQPSSFKPISNTQPAVIAGPPKKIEQDIFLGKDLKPQSKVGITTEVITTKGAEQQIKEAAAADENATVQAVVDSYIASGIPLSSISPQMMLDNDNIKKIGIDNIAKVKSLLDSSKKDKQESAKMMATSGINEIIKFADRIPSSSGMYGLHLQGPQNALVAQFSEDTSSALKNLGANIDSTLASLAKAFGEVGNLSQFDQDSYRGILKLLADPNLKTRADARQSLQNRLTKDMGFDVKISNPYELKKTEGKQQPTWQPPINSQQVKDENGKVFWQAPDGKVYDEVGGVY